MPTILATRTDAVGDLVEAILGFHQALRRRGDDWGGSTAAGLSRTDVLLLGLLGSQGPLRPGRIAAKLGSGPSVVSRHLASLDERGLIVRDTDPLDGRAELVSLSREGRERLAVVRDAMAAQLAARLGDWEVEDVRRATDLVADLVDRLVHDPVTTDQP